MDGATRTTALEDRQGVRRRGCVDAPTEQAGYSTSSRSDGTQGRQVFGVYCSAWCLVLVLLASALPRGRAHAHVIAPRTRLAACARARQVASNPTRLARLHLLVDCHSLRQLPREPRVPSSPPSPAANTLPTRQQPWSRQSSSAPPVESARSATNAILPHYHHALTLA